MFIPQHSLLNYSCPNINPIYTFSGVKLFRKLPNKIQIILTNKNYLKRIKNNYILSTEVL